jgi:hypothetical protein
MQLKEFKQIFPLALFSIKQAYLSQIFSQNDSNTLKALFWQAKVYQSVLEKQTRFEVNVTQNIFSFFELIQKVLPEPQNLNMDINEIGSDHVTGANQFEDVLTELKYASHNILKAFVLNMLIAFQCSILDLAAKLKSDNGLSQTDIESANYVIGMAEITSINLTSILHQDDLLDMDNYEHTGQFLQKSVHFVESLHSAGLGYSATLQ